MRWIGVLALTSALYATGVVAQCQSNLGAQCGDSSRPREMNCCDKGYCQPWNSGYYQCVAKIDKCPKQETDIDYAGNDIIALYGLQPDKCCDACAATLGCKVYTFVNENPDGRTACYLKKSAAGRTEKKGAVSGTLSDAPPTATCSSEEEGVDYYGNDIGAVYGVSIGECCNRCGVTTNCGAYTYIAASSACYLKTSAAGRRAKAGAVSATLALQGAAAPPSSSSSSSSGNCSAPEIDVDYYGNDIKNVMGLSAGDCCSECGKTAKCGAYTYIAATADATSACYLKTSAAGRRAKAGAVSATLALQGAAAPPSSSSRRCLAYTFTQQTADGTSACYLKYSSAGKVPKAGVVSGQINCPPKNKA